MNQNDFRLGNYLENFLGQIFQVQTLPISGMFPEPKPISITKKRLLKLGFKKDSIGRPYIDINFNQSLSWQGNILFLITCGMEFEVTYTELLHVTKLHHVQNLYFALKGEELTFEL